MNRRDITVIIPVYNEDPNNLRTLCVCLRKENISYLVVDDGSDIPIADDLPEYVTVKRRPKNKGYGNAIKWAMRSIKTKYVALIDADLQYDIVDLVDMCDALDDEDLLIGKRVTHQGGLRRMAGRLFIKTIASLSATRYIPDLNSGARVFNRRLALDYASLLCDEFSFTTSMTLCFILDKYIVKWVPIGFYPRKGTPSTVKMVRHGLITLYQIALITVGLRTRKLRARLRRS